MTDRKTHKKYYKTFILFIFLFPIPAGFVFSEIEWAKEWDEIVAIASPEPRKNTKSNSRRRSLLIEKSYDSLEESIAVYESLEEIHVLALAHILRRTIIVISDVFLRDMNGEAFSPIPFGGVYLPFEVPSNECHRCPLLLAYDMAHFSALVAMETVNDYPPALIPLTDCTNQLLPIQFCIDPGKDFNWREYDGSDGNWILTDREHIALLKEYLDVIYTPTNESPDDDIYDDYSDEEYEKKMSNGEIAFSDENCSNGINQQTEATQTTPTPPAVNGSSNKSKAARQLQSVAKQFGSIGKSMSKKLKKNIGSITRIGSKNNHKKSSISSEKSTQSLPKCKILCAQLKARRHEYQEEMIKNYLECAQERFLESEKLKERRELEKYHKYDCEYIDGNTDDMMNCINAGCLNYGTVATSYMCLDCFEMQKKHERETELTEYVARYGTGKSRFYAKSDLDSHSRIQKLPSVRRLNEMDQTLYLSKSTFYNDKKPEVINSLNEYGFSPTGSNGKYVEKIGNSYSSDYSNCAKNVSSGFIASVYSPGNSLRNGMLVSLPPPSNSLPTSSSMSSSSSSGSTFNETNKNGDINKKANVSNFPLFNNDNQLCRTEGCSFYGSKQSNYLCSKCGQGI